MGLGRPPPAPRPRPVDGAMRQGLLHGQHRRTADGGPPQPHWPLLVREQWQARLALTGSDGVYGSCSSRGRAPDASNHRRRQMEQRGRQTIFF